MLAANSAVSRFLEAIADLDLVLRVMCCMGRIDNMLYTAAENSTKVWEIVLRKTICRAAH